ncbi:hypothetical protein [Phycicoccus duodecadis]|uniref:Uncharacterized protein n=1 Tax=Phycicoccus duodecadis TaxID=173053 RepID=A0A2N3YMC7_9MICO|nr:hypothetical protein [Phycicoccus duodecadis]PKW27984.1 hypothetical protein ATL31_2837 [Phycicoccus duodecadis]
MAGYKQYTLCSQPMSWMSPAAYIATATAAIAAIFALLGYGTFPCGLILIEAFAAAGGVAFCDWWLNIRLVCLGGDESVIGAVISVETPQEKVGNVDLGDPKTIANALDTDYSINLLVYPTMPGVDQAHLETSVPYGYLAAETDGVRDHVGFFTGEKARDKKGVLPSTAVLHAEFEGAGIADFRVGLLVAYGLALAAWALCVALPPPFGWIVGGILALLALLAALLGGAIGVGDAGSPSDVEGAPTEIHQPDDKGLGSDLLYVRGRWVFDSLHTGWNELHPIKACTVVGSWDGDWSSDTVGVKDRLDAAFDAAERDDVIKRQGKTEHQWRVHPLVDGCELSTEPAPDGGPVLR